ncbi:MAG: hypothetical protein JWN96_1813, partial [Mycobacterium sp.]|nr:hypothetical protein [Mycobacterium sp.]
MAAPGQAAAAPTVATIAAALQHSSVYVDPATQASGGPTIDAARLTPVVPKGVYVAVLQASAVPAGDDPTELPALISSGVGQGGTFVIMIGTHFYGASTTIPGQLADDLATAQSALPTTGDATPALIALVRALDGSGDVQDAASPARAGGPIGTPLLVVIFGVLIVGGLSLWWVLRRKPRKPRRRRVEPLRDLVEIDTEGEIIRRTPASERER